VMEAEHRVVGGLLARLWKGVCTSAASLHRIGASQKQELPGALVLPLRSLADLIR
jgi:hypothetical protein